MLIWIQMQTRTRDDQQLSSGCGICLVCRQIIFRLVLSNAFFLTCWNVNVLYWTNINPFWLISIDRPTLRSAALFSVQAKLGWPHDHWVCQYLATVKLFFYVVFIIRLFLQVFDSKVTSRCSPEKDVGTGVHPAWTSYVALALNVKKVGEYRSSSAFKLSGTPPVLQQPLFATWINHFNR